MKYVVGIGASAGGLEALEKFFERMPEQTGLAFVVIQHLSPDFKSLTNELLARRTRIPIHAVEDGMAVHPDAIFLLPPRKDMIISDGRLYLSDKDPSPGVTLPIDYFLRSLAQDQQQKAIAVILSGTGSDGSRGIREIHDAGGLVVVQSLESAKFDGMPKSALKTGVVDVDLPPEDMAGAILKYISHPLDRHTIAEPQIPLQGMEAVMGLLRNQCAIDFSCYKPTTVARRTERRLLLSGLTDLDEYIERLANDPAEVSALYKDLLIGVTRFFRDREAFDLLEHKILPTLLKQTRTGQELRIWVAACATGEEAYSIAMLVQEQMERLNRIVNVKIFATDAHRDSLEFASAGRYSEPSLIDIGPGRLQRFFIAKGDSFQVTPEVRKLVVFAHHDLLSDAPFTKLDLVTCRNLLIYLQPQAQKKVLSHFHFGLRAGGCLFLGPSEGPGELDDEFDIIDPRWRFYRKRRDVRLTTEISTPVDRPYAPVLRRGQEPQLLPVYDALLAEVMPPSLLISEEYQVVQTFGGGSKFLRLHDGRLTTHVLDMVDSDLKMALSGALPRAFRDSQPVAYKGLLVRLGDRDMRVNVMVKPVNIMKPGQRYALISLVEIEMPAAQAQSPEEIQRGQASEEQLRSLESELRYTHENLQATIEELETSNEELQSTNEELVSSNEELQSTNEELHSVNEELYTVNGEYQKKIVELSEMTVDIENLLSSTQVHTIFLDRDLRIRRFTPRIGQTFNIASQDIGRRIDSFTNNIDYPGLLDDMRAILARTPGVHEEFTQADESPIYLERHVQNKDGRQYLLRVLPYRSGNAVEGLVLTLVDVTSLRRAEAAMHSKDEQLRSILQNMPHLVNIMDASGRFVLAGESYHRLLGSDPTGKTLHQVFPAEIADRLVASKKKVLATGEVVEGEVVLPHADGDHTYLSVNFPLRDQTGRIVGVGGIKTDVTGLKDAEEQARSAVQQRDRFLAMLSHELRNPLTAMLNTVAILQRSELPEELKQPIGIVQRRSGHMARLLDDLLDVTRINQDKIEIRKQAIDLSSTQQETLEVVRSRFADREIQLTATRSPAPLPVHGDPARLQQIQINLLLNACKCTPPGGEVFYSMQREEDHAVIRVRDTGVGIRKDMLERVFDLYIQADSNIARDDQSEKGLGVGLTLVRSLVRMHGGSVRAYSEGPGKGSEFVVTLPLSSDAAIAANSNATLNASSEQQPANGEAAPRSLDIVLVEDDHDVRESLKTILEYDGHRVRAAVDGSLACALVEQQLPRVVIVDIGLPGMNGYEVARHLRKSYDSAAIHLIALTGYGQTSDREAARAAGFDSHLTKPLRPEDLAMILASI